MRDEDGGAPLHDLAQVIQDAVFGLRVHAGQRVVEHQDARIANQGAGNRRALFLSAGERYAALAHQRVVALRESPRCRSAMLAASAARRTSSSVACSRAESDVLADGVAEQKRLLRHEADVARAATQAGTRGSADRQSAPNPGRRRRCAGSARPASICPNPSARQSPGWCLRASRRLTFFNTSSSPWSASGAASRRLRKVLP